METRTSPQPNEDSQKRFLLSLFLSSFLFAVGTAVFFFGLSPRYLATSLDQAMVTVSGLALIVGSVVIAYFTLK